MRNFLKDLAEEFADCDAVEKVLVIFLLLLVFIILILACMLLRILFSPW